MKATYILTIFFVLLSSGCIGGASDKQDEGMMSESMEDKPADNMPAPAYMDVSVEEAKQLIDSKPELVIIDVSPHYDAGHVPGAMNYYVGDGSLDNAIPALDKNKEYLVYCHVDSASILGAQKLIDAGFTRVYRMEGNYAAWVGQGYPIEK